MKDNDRESTIFHLHHMLKYSGHNILGTRRYDAFFFVFRIKIIHTNVGFPSRFTNYFTLHASSSMEPGLTMCTFTQMCTLTTPRRRLPSCGLQFPRLVNESNPKSRFLHKTLTERDYARFSYSPSTFLHLNV